MIHINIISTIYFVSRAYSNNSPEMAAILSSRNKNIRIN